MPDLTRPPRVVSRAAEWTLAASLSAVGLSTVALRLLGKPTSWLSRAVDRHEVITRGQEVSR